MYRFARIPQLAALVCVMVFASGRTLAAQDAGLIPEADNLLSVSPVDRSSAIQPLLAPVAPATPAWFTRPPQRRPRAMLPLYSSYATLQVLDAHSTTRALDRGAAEANPLMRGVAGRPGGMLAVKAAGTAGVIYAGEKLWKRNRTAAVIFMVAANSAMALVVQHNYRTVR
jgi:hypothetical protein